MSRIEYVLLGLDREGVEPDVLDEVERARAARFAGASARSRFVRVRSALRMEIARRLGVDPRDLRFAYGRSGKPALAPPFDRARLEFSVAHSDRFALLAFANAVAVGADLERVRPLRDGPGVARRVLPPHEIARLATLTGPAWTESFFRLWTRREALVKCVGGSVLAPAPDEAGFAIADVAVPPGYAAALCAAASGLTVVERPLYSAG